MLFHHPPYLRVLLSLPPSDMKGSIRCRSQWIISLCSEMPAWWNPKLGLIAFNMVLNYLHLCSIFLSPQLKRPPWQGHAALTVDFFFLTRKWSYCFWSTSSSRSCRSDMLLCQLLKENWRYYFLCDIILSHLCVSVFSLYCMSLVSLQPWEMLICSTFW